MIVCLSRQCRHYAPPTSAVRLVNLISRSPPLSKDRNALAVCHGIISPLISPSVLVLGALLHGSLLPLITCLRVIYICIYIQSKVGPMSVYRRGFLHIIVIKLSGLGLGFETSRSRLFLRSRDQDQDLSHLVSRPRPRPEPLGLETKTKTLAARSRDRDQDLSLQVSSELEFETLGLEITSLIRFLLVVVNEPALESFFVTFLKCLECT